MVGSACESSTCGYVRDMLGWSVSLSYDGRYLAVGAYQYVRVYEWKNAGGFVWMAHYASGHESTKLDEDGRYYGTVQISGDGNRLAVAAGNWVRADGGSPQGTQARLRVFERVSARAAPLSEAEREEQEDNPSGTDSWVQIGADLSSASAWDGFSLQLISQDGSIVSFSGGGQHFCWLKVFRYDGDGWVQKGSTFTATKVDFTCGSTLGRLSNDGLSIALRHVWFSASPDGRYTSSTVDLRRWDPSSSSWPFVDGTRITEPFLNPYAREDIALTGNVTRIAVGYPHTHSSEKQYAGAVHVFDYGVVSPEVPSPAVNASNSSSPGAVSVSCSSDGNSRATGGTVTTFGDYTIHTFTSSGTFQVTDSTLTEVELLVVGGGGGGSGGGYSSTEYRAGGGGGGAVVHHASKNVAVQSYTVSIGDGGGGGNGVLGGVGSPSSFGDTPDVVQAGGGGGADCCPGTSGGWSGGSSGNAGGSAWMGCQGVTSGGGGGGAGGPGMDGFNDGSSLGCRGGDGGVGIQLNISGTQVYYGGGGGGGTNWGVTMSTGGSGNGTWRQSDFLQSSTPGTPNTGGGGGGGAYYSDSGGSNGGSGIVIVRYKSTTCNDQSCATDYYHDGSDCVACPTGSNRLPDTANQCLCPRAHTHTTAAAACPGYHQTPGDTVPGGDATNGGSSASPPLPSSSSSAAPSAQDKKAAAEKRAMRSSATSKTRG